jgi:hypothetical protein
MEATLNPTTGVISEAWDHYTRHWKHLLPISFVVYAIVGLLSLLFSTLGWIGALLASAVSIVGLYLMQGALTEAVADVRDGRADLSIGDTFRRVSPKLGAVIGAGLLAGFGIAIGLLLLIVPGLILLTLWAVIIPVIILEGKGVFDSFGRSQQLVRGHGFSVFGVIVLTFLILFAFTLVLALLLAPLDDGVASFFSNLISGTITAPFIAAAWTILYYRLAGVEGATPQMTAQGGPPSATQGQPTTTQSQPTTTQGQPPTGHGEPPATGQPPSST